MMEIKSLFSSSVSFLEKAEKFQTFLVVACIYAYANLVLMYFTKHQVYELTVAEVKNIEPGQFIFIVAGYFLFMGYIGRLVQIAIVLLKSVFDKCIPRALRHEEPSIDKEDIDFKERVFQYSMETGDHKPYEWVQEEIKSNREIKNEIEILNYRALCLFILILANHYIAGDRLAMLNPELISVEVQLWTFFPLIIGLLGIQLGRNGRERIEQPELKKYLAMKDREKALPMVKQYSSSIRA